MFQKLNLTWHQGTSASVCIQRYVPQTIRTFVKSVSRNMINKLNAEQRSHNFADNIWKKQNPVFLENVVIFELQLHWFLFLIAHIYH